MKANSLGKNERLKSRKLIAELFKSGKGFNAFPFRVVYILSSNDIKNATVAIISDHARNRSILKEEEFALKAGFSVSTRNFKKAVDRNRIKRFMRENYRIRKSGLAEILNKNGKKLVFFIIFTGKELPEHDLIGNKISVVIEKLIKVINESAP